jgi:predicted nucleic acid-binding protein
VTFLLDVNALVALGFIHHEFHERMARWVTAEGFPALATCSTTELGFVRVLSQVAAYGFTVAEARGTLMRLKRTKLLPFSFIADDHDISHLPAWVKNPKQTTDGHLTQLAAANSAMLATLDQKIPGAFLVP